MLRIHSEFNPSAFDYHTRKHVHLVTIEADVRFWIRYLQSVVVETEHHLKKNLVHSIDKEKRNKNRTRPVPI